MPEAAFRTPVDILLVEDNPNDALLLERVLEGSRLRKTIHLVEPLHKSYAESRTLGVLTITVSRIVESILCIAAWLRSPEARHRASTRTQ